MTVEINEAFNSLMDMEMWESAVVALGGYLAPTVVENVASGRVPEVVDHPEVYGIATIAGAEFAPAYTREVQVGAGVYTAENVAERAGLRDTIVSVGA